MIFNRGFSFVEILIASAVVVLSGLGTLKLYSYIEVARANAAFWISAQNLAIEQIAVLQRVNTENDSCNSSAVTFDNVKTCKLTLDESSPFDLNALEIELIKQLELSVDGTNSEVFAKILNVRVTWIDRNAEERELNMPVTVTKISNLLN